MTRRNQMIVLGVLVAVLGVTLFLRSRSSDDCVKTRAAARLFTPVNVDNPALRMDILQRFLSLQYKGAHRNIFVASLPPPPPPPPMPAVVVAPPVQTGPPPLTVEAKYFRLVSDPKASNRRAFFATPNNEDDFIAGEGATPL